MATKNLFAAAALIAMGITATGVAHADALAQSALTVSNFRILSGGSTLSTSQLSSLTFVDSTTLTANLNGSNAPAAPVTFSVDGSGIPQQTVCAPAGGCPSPFVAATIPAITTASAAGSSLSGSPIAGATIGGTPGGTPIPVGATARTAALSEVLGNGVGGAQSGLTLSSLISFTTAQALNSLSLSFDANLILNAWTQASSFNSATAGVTLSFVLIDQVTNATLFTWAPQTTSTGAVCNLQATISSNSPPGGTNTGSCSGSFATTANVSLLAGRGYTFAITQQSNTNIISTAAVPEPSALALAGLALTALGLAGRRRNANKAK